MGVVSFHLPPLNAHLAVSFLGAQGSSEVAVDLPPAPLPPGGEGLPTGSALDRVG